MGCFNKRVAHDSCPTPGKEHTAFEAAEPLLVVRRIAAILTHLPETFPEDRIHFGSSYLFFPQREGFMNKD